MVSVIRAFLVSVVVLALGPAGMTGSTSASAAPAAPSGRWVDGTYTNWFGYQPVTPARLADTRPGGATVDGRYSGGGAMLGPGGEQVLVLGRGGIPTVGVGAVMISVTAIATEATFVNVTENQTGSAMTSTSVLNLAAGQTAANSAVIKMTPDGYLGAYNSRGRTHLIIDVLGYFRDTAAEFTPVTAKRVLDSRAGGPTGDGQQSGTGQLGPHGTVAVQIGGRFGVHTGPGTAAVVNVTLVGPSSNTFATIYPGGGSLPLASTVNASAGATVPNLAVVLLDDAGRALLYNDNGTTDVVVDLVGYFQVPSGAVVQPPQRFADTRPGAATFDGQQVGAGAVVGGQTLSVAVAGRGGVPQDAVAVLLNVTGAYASNETYLTAFAGGSARPLSSNLNLASGGTRAVFVMAQVGPDGTVQVFNASGSTHVVVDLVGWVPKPKSGFVGRVVSPGTFTPVGGLPVYATNDNSNLLYSTTTDANGRYQLTGLPEGRFLVCFGAQSPGDPGSHGCFDPFGDVGGVAPEGIQTLNWADNPGSLSGDVVTSQGRYIDGATVTLRPMEVGRTMTGSSPSGPLQSFGFRNVPMDVLVCASAPGFKDGCYTAPGSTGPTLVDPLRHPQRMQLVLQPS